MSSANSRKSAQLGMPLGTAVGRLRKLVLFEILKRHCENVCYRCAKIIESAEQLSLDHKVAWLDKDPELFWDLENVGFAHLRCNIAAANRHSPAKLAQYERLRKHITLPPNCLKESSKKRYERMARQGLATPDRTHHVDKLSIVSE